MNEAQLATRSPDRTSKARPTDTPAIEDATSAIAGVAQRAREAANTVADTATDMSARLPDAASELGRRIQSESDDSLRVLTAGSLGLALGLLVGGASRLLVVASLLAAGVTGLVLSDRRTA